MTKRDFLELLAQPGPETQYAARGKDGRILPATTVNEAVEALGTLNLGQDVWLSLNPRVAGAVDSKHVGKVDQVALVNGFAGDVDFGRDGHKAEDHPPTAEDALAVINAVGIEPTMIVHTGGGFMPLVLLESPYAINCEGDRDRLNNLCRRFANAYRDKGKDQGWRVDGSKSIAQLIRVPGTVNLKVPGQERPVSIHSNSGRRYTLEELEALLPAEAVVEATPREAFTGNIPQGTDARDLLELPCIKNAVDNSWHLPRDEWLIAGRALCHCDNGPEVFRDISRDYSDYNAEVVNAQIRDIRENMRPPLCSSIYREFRGEFCEDCPHFERITLMTGQSEINFRLNSPITLAIRKVYEREEQKQTEGSRPRLVSARTVRTRPLEMRPPPLIPALKWNKGATLMISGETGVGKSFYALELAYALASGTDFLGLPVSGPQKVVIIQSENDAETMRERMESRIAAKGGNEDNLWLVEEGQYASYSGTLVDHNGKPTNNTSKLAETLKETSPDVIIVDPLSDFHTAKENDAIMGVVIKEIQSVARAVGGAGLVIIHHHGKPGKPGEGHTGKHAMRGSSGIAAKAAVIMTVKQTKTQDEVETVKKRGGPISELERIIYCEKRDGCVWRTCQRHAISSTDVRHVCDTVGQIQGKGCFVAMIREREDLKARFENGVVPEQTAEKAIKRALEDGLIIVETVGREKLYRLPEDQQRPGGMETAGGTPQSPLLQ
ncbi:AAA family ATPase [Desulfolutivibrio sp.]|uniref:AAA family ATPase n=1 Tax=Desulfolutivibrio sp. TaxID=2773296 RepID=UPI002F9610AB